MIFKKILNFLLGVRCALVMVKQSILICRCATKNKKNNHQDINELTQRSAIKLLNIVKAKYRLELADPTLLDGQSPFIFMSNHQSLFDLPLIYATMTGTIRPVTKSELFRIPFFGKALVASECIPVNRKSKTKMADFIANAKEKLAAGISIWVFPEGTRSNTQQLLPFKTGGFRLARETLTKIVPVGISNTRAILGARKLSISCNKDIAIRVGKPINVKEYTTDESQIELISKVRTAIEQLITVEN